MTNKGEEPVAAESPVSAIEDRDRPDILNESQKHVGRRRRTEKGHKKGKNKEGKMTWVRRSLIP